MKLLITVVTSLLAGLTLASVDFSSLGELHNIFLHKRRLFGAAVLAFVGFCFVFAGLIVSLVEGALQFDAQGFVMWSALFTVGSGLAFFGVAFLLGSWALIPTPSAVHQNIWAELNREFHLSEIAERFLHSLHEKSEAAGDEKFAEMSRPPDPPIQNQPLHH